MKTFTKFLKNLFSSDTRSRRPAKVEKTAAEQITDELNRPVNRGG